jgi:thiosulfate dehydrogenase (quinone) large subunit
MPLMIVAFVESIKYIGHMLPIAFLRIFFGYFYMSRFSTLLDGDFLHRAFLAEDIRAFAPKSTSPEWFKLFLDTTVVPNWQAFAYLIAVGYCLIGISYLFGYLVRPASVLGLVLAVGLSMAVGTTAVFVQPLFLIVIHIVLGWVGAGRCLGFDYYFYKRRRGLWW